ncbi:MAG: hypothetical protein J5I90_01770 [Caldilineales bacterium]|nr:hypothetical protein [Caldilineales bacterium]
MFEEGVGSLVNGNSTVTEIMLNAIPGNQATGGWAEAIQLQQNGSHATMSASDFCQRFCRSGGCGSKTNEHQAH